LLFPIRELGCTVVLGKTIVPLYKETRNKYSTRRKVARIAGFSLVQPVAMAISMIHHIPETATSISLFFLKKLVIKNSAEFNLHT